MVDDINIAYIEKLRTALDGHLVKTPLLRCFELEKRFSSGTKILAKLEFLQNTGTFKLRGALASILSLGKEELSSGVVAVSAGNHAIAVAYAAKSFGLKAKVVMPKSSNKFRVSTCQKLGAEVVFAENSGDAFEIVNLIKERENLNFIHPFEGQSIVNGTATLGYEICNQSPNMNALIIPIGGGGLCSGLSSFVRKKIPECGIYGVEPIEANTMYRSLKENAPQTMDNIETIADSLAAPFAMPISFEYCKKNIDGSHLVSEKEISIAMSILFDEMNLVVEPACATSTAALLGPLKEELDGKTIILILCGSNIDWLTYEQNISIVR